MNQDKDAEAQAASAPVKLGTPMRRLWRRGPGLVPSLLALPLLGGALGCGLWWSMATEPGTQWLLQQVPGLQITRPQGSLIGDFSAQKLSYVVPGTQDRLEFEDLSWQGLSLHWNRSPQLWGDLHIKQLTVRRLQVHLAPSDAPSQAPADLKLPIGVQLKQLQIAQLLIPSASALPLLDLQGSLQLSAQGGNQHQVQLDSLHWDRLQLRGSASLQTAGDMGVQAQLNLRAKANEQDHIPAWQAKIEARGPLQTLTLSADLQAESQTLQAEAQVQPFASWPLPQLQLKSHQLDLSALASGLPRTSLSGQASLLGQAAESSTKRPGLTLKSQLNNSLAGRWNEQLLPIRTLNLDLSFVPGDPAALGIRELELLLGSAKQPAGRVQAKGQSSKERGSALILAISDVNSEALDARAASLQLAGEIELSTATPINQLGGDGLPAAHLTLAAKLEGRLLELSKPPTAKAPALGLPRSAPISLQAQALLSNTELQLQSFLLRFDDARLEASGKLGLKQAASLSQGWQAQAQAQAQIPDLRRLWRGDAGSAWQQNVQALSAQLEAQLQAGPLPAGGLNQADKLYAYAPQGTARLQLQPTQLAGVPLSAELRYEHAARQQAPRLQGQLTVGPSNRLQARGELAPSGELQASAELQFPELSSLQPLLSAFKAGASSGASAQAAKGGTAGVADLAPKLRGSLLGNMQLQAGLLAPQQQGKPGTRNKAPAANSKTAAPLWRWHSQAQLQARGLQLSGSPSLQALNLSAADLQWQLDSAHDAPLSLNARLERLSSKDWAVPQATLSATGSWAKHRLDMQALAEGKMPAALVPPGPASDQLLRGPITLGMNGRLSQAPPLAWRDGAQWQASELTLSAQAEAPVSPTKAGMNASPGKASPEPPPTSPWLNAQNLQLKLDLAPQGQLQQVQLQPGRLELVGAGLSWQSLQWAAADPAAGAGSAAANDRFTLDLRLEPLAVAPLLARWQPHFGWSGDLVVVGHAQVRSEPGFHVDVALERSRGDLIVIDDRGKQKLELSEFRLGVIGSPGVWHLTHALAGSNVGVLGAALTARNEDPSQWWPSTESRLEGVLEAQVANLSTWGAWVPAGWRIGGSIFTTASFAGRLKAPEIKGRAGGSGLVLRNPLLGVDMQRGEFALSLDGGHARLEQFKAYAGDGDLSAYGELTFGAHPRADLHLLADKFGVLRRVDQRLAVNGRIDMSLDPQLFEVQGKLDVHEGLFDFSRGNAPVLDDDVSVTRPQTEQQEADGKAVNSSKAPAKVRVKVDIDLGKKLRVKGYGLDTLLAGQLQLSQGPSGPALHGRISTERGTFDAYGQKLAIEKGLISFSGVVDNPRLDVLALRPSQEEQRVGVTITGTAQKPRVKLYSEPALDERSTLSWLLLGRAPSELGSQDSALLSSAALALISGQGESPTSKLIKSVGLDELSFSESGVEAQGTVVRLGKQLSRRLYVGYERGLNATAGSWQLIYRLAQRFTLRAQSGDDNAVDLIWQWKWE
ncbi:translocation/assembly module TamB domain-containing protein [Kinneretia asaccharophila]|uniref:Translocation and assembly module TamB n=1 Tax=Roseateles asaccharophilus TaxID=582607 RepID=A0A4R6MU95_9BURK|nr:translocation/assembly module TamB domain-containing protein [Roseateles asaccharophilus]MDN3546277.1 translocation/assembly module TamB domain-containing protein [Roseateles asaccharophilus]TDP05621.1 translocation and assembly module TamB [Roseateles asaccharophilus]